MSRKRTVDSQRDLEELVDDYVDRGYKVTSSGEQKSVVKDRSLGGWKLHTGLLFLTAGFGNVAYMIYRRLTADTVKIVVENKTE